MQSEASQTSNIAPITDLRTIQKPNKKQRKFIEQWLNPKSSTFGNTYQSAIAAGFTDSTARVLTANSRNTPWIQEIKQLLTHMQPEHIYLAMQQIALDGKSDRDKLRALELMGKHTGMFIERTQSDIHVTFSNSVPRPITEVESTITPSTESIQQGE